MHCRLETGIVHRSQKLSLVWIYTRRGQLHHQKFKKMMGMDSLKKKRDDWHKGEKNSKIRDFESKKTQNFKKYKNRLNSFKKHFLRGFESYPAIFIYI